MISIKISDPDTCKYASEWCKSNINNWRLSFEFGKTTTYVFEFDDARYATLFALKWVH
jgi:hypothetical protein